MTFLAGFFLVKQCPKLSVDICHKIATVRHYYAKQLLRVGTIDDRNFFSGFIMRVSFAFKKQVCLFVCSLVFLFFLFWFCFDVCCATFSSGKLQIFFSRKEIVHKDRLQIHHHLGFTSFCLSRLFDISNGPRRICKYSTWITCEKRRSYLISG